MTQSLLSGAAWTFTTRRRSRWSATTRSASSCSTLRSRVGGRGAGWVVLRGRSWPGLGEACHALEALASTLPDACCSDTGQTCSASPQTELRAPSPPPPPHTRGCLAGGIPQTLPRLLETLKPRMEKTPAA